MVFAINPTAAKTFSAFQVRSFISFLFDFGLFNSFSLLLKPLRATRLLLLLDTLAVPLRPLLPLVQAPRLPPTLLLSWAAVQPVFFLSLV
jgi:hypothetical protein